jgi:hypothetical protein
MAKSKDPAFLFYPSDFIMGTYTMTDEQVGKYIRLLCLQFSKGGKLTERDLMSINRDNDPYIMEKFTFDGEYYYNERLKEVVDEREAKAEINRENGKKGGNPNFTKGKNNPYYNQKDNQTVIKSVIKKDNPSDKRKINITLEDENINVIKDISYFKDEDLNKTFIDFMKMRKSLKNGAMTERAIKMMINKLNSYQVEVAIQMLEQSIINNWKDIYELKSDNRLSKTQQKDKRTDDMLKRAMEAGAFDE